MRRTRSDTELAEALRAWGRLRLLVLAVTEARNGHRCEYEERAEADVGDIGVPPCWKAREWNYAHEPMNADEWCAPCLARHRWHLALVTIKRIHGGRLRRLQRIALAPMKSEAA